MDDQWGPWIKHDGSCMPVARGQVVHVVWADGTEVAAQNHGQSAAAAGVLGFDQSYQGPFYKNSWDWSEPGNKIPVEKYRFRKPKGMALLEQALVVAPVEVVHTMEPRP